MLNIKEIPLLFSTPMVQALMEDRKSQTRRTRGLEGLEDHYFQSLVHHAYGHFTFCENGNYDPKNEDVKVATCPYGKRCDLLWVRETHYAFGHWTSIEDSFTLEKKWKFNDLTLSENLPYLYADSPPDIICKGRFGLGYFKRPSIHMPKVSSRIWLMVEEIRVERLQDISEEDAVAEGVIFQEGVEKFGCCWYDYEINLPVLSNPKNSFKTLWQSINGRESWKQNPWVWVVRFRTLSKTGRPSDELIVKNRKEVTNG